jgi:hypothetical protein
MSDNNDLIFISYASPDRQRVCPYHDSMKARGFDVWMDVARIKPGQSWDFEIQRALNRAALIIVFISNNSVTRRGYVQREIKVALDKAMERLASDIYLIPVMLDDDAPIPDELKHIHIVRASASDCIEKIEDAIRHQLQQLGSSVAEAQGRANIRWWQTSYRESWEGLPGYEVEFRLLNLSSEQYPKIGEVTDIIRGDLLSAVANERTTKFTQSTELFNFGQQSFSRTNTWEAFPAAPKIVEKTLSLQYSVHWYGAGAAHPNHHFSTYCFLLDPLVQIKDLRNAFTDQERAFQLIQESTREQLLLPSPDGEERLSLEWVLEGTKDWDSFRSFGFEQDGIEFYFAPYQVAAYAAGAQFVKVPFDKVKTLLLPWLRNSLGHR